MSDIQMNKEDLTLEAIEPELCATCQERTATHYLQIDLRAVGSTTQLGGDLFCQPCGEEELETLKGSMPDPLNEEGTF